MISIKKYFTSEYILRTLIAILMVASLIFSLFVFLVRKDTVRRTFIFPSVDNGQFIIEYRNLNKEPVQGDVNLFIDELLLGSTIERTKSLFTPGTKVLSCFQRGEVLYLNLSSDLLNMGEDVIEIKEGMDLLEKNIKKNFSKIHEVLIFVNGKIAFEN